MGRSRGRSLTEDVYAELRSQVLHGVLRAGTRIHLGQVAKASGVSLGVVREAVTRLAGERLLDATPQTGFRVRSLSPEHLADLTWARRNIERLVVEQSLLHGDSEWEGELVAAHHVLAITPAVVDGQVNPTWMNAHRRFHTTLAAGCPNETLCGVRQSLFDEAELYRHWSARGDGINRDIAAEHADIVEAALARDVAATLALMDAHLEQTAQLAGSTASAGGEGDGVDAGEGEAGATPHAS